MVAVNVTKCLGLSRIFAAAMPGEGWNSASNASEFGGRVGDSSHLFSRSLVTNDKWQQDEQSQVEKTQKAHLEQ